MSEFFNPESARGVWWDDLTLQIEWPVEIQIISEKDYQYLDYTEI